MRITQESSVTISFNRLVRDDEGQDLIEYALLAGLISIVAIAGITLTGTSLQEKFAAIGEIVAAVPPK